MYNDHFNAEVTLEETHHCQCHEIPTELLECGVECDECSYHTKMMIQDEVQKIMRRKYGNKYGIKV